MGSLKPKMQVFEFYFSCSFFSYISENGTGAFQIVNYDYALP